MLALTSQAQAMMLLGGVSLVGFVWIFIVAVLVRETLWWMNSDENH